jgi:dihydroxyacetone kinase-like predicted kinase
MFERMYTLEFLLTAQGSDSSAIRKALSEIGQDMVVTAGDDRHAPGHCFKVSIRTLNPELVFDVCGQFGRITSVKIDEVT